MVPPLLKIAGRSIGSGQPCFIIAEVGVNHNGDVALGHQLVEAAARAGADAVKFQTFNADRLATVFAPKAHYQRQMTDAAESQHAMLSRLELSKEAHQELWLHCRDRNILFLSTPFDEESADFLDNLGVAAFKLPSGEITNTAFLAHVARKHKLMIVSTGMSSLGEVEAAVSAIWATGNKALVLLHCVSNYPADPAEANLRAMHTLATAFGVPVGFSDHTPGSEVALAAAALGACIIEKHLTLDCNLPGPDHKASLEPDRFADVVRTIRVVESALGTGRKGPAVSEANTAAVARKSLVAARDMEAGTLLTAELVALKRPGTGLPPALLPHVLGRRSRIGLKAGDLLSFDVLQ